MADWTTNKDLIQKLYIAFYGRPADPGGLRYWASQLPDNAQPNSDAVRNLIDRFINSPEAESRFGSPSLDAVIDRVINFAYHRDATVADREGVSNVVDLLVKVISVSSGSDYASLNNKLQYANWFVEILDPNGDGIPNDDSTGAKFTATYSGNTDSNNIASKLNFIDAANPTTREQVINDIKTVVADEGDQILNPVVPQDFVLTTGVDNIVLNNTQKKVIGIVDTNNAISTLNAGDVIVGTGVEDDELRVILNASDYAGTATIKDVDNIIVQIGAGAAVAFNATGITGAKKIIMENAVGDQTIQNIDDLNTAVGIRNTTKSLTANWQNSLLLGTSDAVTVILDTATGGGAQNVTVSNGVEIVNLKTEGGASDINNITDAVNGGTFKTLNIDAQANLIISKLDADVTKVDASASTKNVRIGFGTGQNIEFKGGKGDDRITFDADGFNANDTVSGGDGTDRLDVTLNAANLATKNNITGFEIISASAGGNFTFNLQGNTDIKEFRVIEDGAANTITLTNLEKVLEKVVYEGNGNPVNQIFDNLTVNLAPGKGTGTSDATIVEVVNDKALATGNAFNLGTLTLPSVEDVTIDVKASGNANLTLADTALRKLTLVSAKNITFNAALNSTNLETVDASGVQGTLTIDTSTSNKSVNVTVGGKVDITVGDGDGADDITTIVLGGSGGNIIREQPGSITNGFFIAQNFVAGVGGDVIDLVNGSEYYQEVLANVAASTNNGGIIVITNENAMPITGNDEATLVSNFRNWAAGVSFDDNGFSTNSNENTNVIVEGDDGNVYIFRVTGVDNTAGITTGDTVQLIGILTGTNADASDLYVGNFI